MPVRFAENPYMDFLQIMCFAYYERASIAQLFMRVSIEALASDSGTIGKDINIRICQKHF